MTFRSEKYLPEVAYLSMGVFLEPYLPTYSGGLEILAGDTLRSCADLRINIAGISQVSSSGYFYQSLNNDWQTEEPIYYKPKSSLERIKTTVRIAHKDRNITVGAEFYEIVGETGFKVPVFLLDTNFPENNNEDRLITGMLYDSDNDKRISQENVLGQAGVKLMRALGYNSIKTFHMNEGHAAFACLELLKENGFTEKEVKKICVLTNHTPVDAGFDKFDYGYVKHILGNFLPANIKELAGENKLNMTKLAVNLSRYVNGVSKKHGEVCNYMEIFKDKKIDYITNGVHPRTWAVSPMSELFDSRMKYWALDPGIFEDISKYISPRDFSEAKLKSKRHLVGWLNSENPIEFNSENLTLVWSRRFTPYKRPELLFRNMDRLHKISEKYPLQIIYSGKAHPADGYGKSLLKGIIETINKMNGNENLKGVFIKGYDTQISRRLLGGAEVWLSTPRRPLEASGTSWIKAALNGCMNLGTYDGGICEGVNMSPETILLVGPKKEQSSVTNDPEEDKIDSDGLCDSLEEIADLYYNHPEEFEKRRAKAPSIISHFNTHRMVKQYARKSWDIEV